MSRWGKGEGLFWGFFFLEIRGKVEEEAKLLALLLLLLLLLLLSPLQCQSWRRDASNFKLVPPSLRLQHHFEMQSKCIVVVPSTHPVFPSLPNIFAPGISRNLFALFVLGNCLPLSVLFEEAPFKPKQSNNALRALLSFSFARINQLFLPWLEASFLVHGWTDMEGRDNQKDTLWTKPPKFANFAFKKSLYLFFGLFQETIRSKVNC